MDRPTDRLNEQASQHSALHARARGAGVNMVVYRIARLLLVPFFKLYFRLDRISCDHIPTSGGAIIAANHRSFLDPFVIGACARRPLYFVAKSELFQSRWQAWILNSLGAFPVSRGQGDEETITTAKAILARGEIVLIFPEGTRTRPGTLGTPKRGVGRLALETGVPVIPVAIHGTEAVRRGWRIRPHKVRVRAGRPLHFPQFDHASPQLAAAVTNRIWPCVALQWEWLGGLAPIRRACVIGAGSWGASLAVSLAHAGYEVDLESDTLELSGQDLVCIAVPAESLPGVMATHGERIPRDAGVLLWTTGLVPPHGSSPAAFVAERCQARAVAVIAVTDEADGSGPAATVASSDRGFSRQISDLLKHVGMDVTVVRDVSGLERQLVGDVVDVQAA